MMAEQERLDGLQHQTVKNSAQSLSEGESGKRSPIVTPEYMATREREIVDLSGISLRCREFTRLYG